MKNSYLLLLIAGVVLTVNSCSGNGEPKEETTQNNARSVSVETVRIEPGDFEDSIRLTGKVEALEDATVASESSGRVLSILNRGEEVRKGDVMIQLDDRMIQAQYSAASAGFELALDTYERLEALYADSIISTQDFLSARAQRDQARSQLDLAEKQLGDTRIVAPFSGRIEERMIRTGELVNPGQPVVRLVNSDKIRVTAGIPERYSGEISEGDPVEIILRSLDDNVRAGSITYAGSVIDPDTRTFAIEVELENQDGRLKPDMIADLRVRRAVIRNTIVIPRTAVIRDETGVFVFKSVMENGKKVSDLVSVTTGMASGSLIQILSGIREGDEVVVSGMRTLSIGDELNILSSESSRERAVRLIKADVQTASHQN
ncbi:MAG: efflux RND transporter periplasmic adaptor subunit [Balneolaceae bacterium]|nr:MAG: efflux RND transporter periplasmic adaptor subunit [Balneolaceae bacterium]